jgi:hypothetical protein
LETITALLNGNLRGSQMSTTIVLSKPKSFLLRRSTLGVPLAIWALSLLLIAAAAHIHSPTISFDPQEVAMPF